MAKRRVQALIVLSICFYLVLSSCQHNSIFDKKAPDFTLNDLAGSPYSLKDAKGKVVILDFWASWCPPCKMELPHFQALYDKYRDKGLVVIGISVDRISPAQIAAFTRANGMTYPVLVATQDVVDSYGGVRDLPTTFVISRKGRIIKKFVGYQNRELFEALVRELL